MKEEKKLAVVNNKPLKARIFQYRWFYVMFLPVLIFILLFNYLPMIGYRYAFYEYKSALSIKWVGLDNFVRLLSTEAFWSAFINTLQLSIVKLLMNTGMAVVISLLLNEIKNLTFKKVTQTIIYLPHFMSWVVTASVFALILSISESGLVNNLLLNLGLINDGEQIYFLGTKATWRFSYYIINIWKDTGWGTILFLATLSGINPEIYEAATIDGASRFSSMRYITLPALSNTIITVLILNLAKIMNLFESVFVLINDNVIDVAQVLQTYTYDITFAAAPDFGFSTAVGLFRSLVACVLVLGCNYASKKVRNRGIV
jgi:putative aldouronate transport system permease protein